MNSKFKLIDGEFSAGEARVIIGKLLEFKIQYHSKQNFGSEILKGFKDELSLSRKESLKNTNQEFLTYLENFTDDDFTTIHSDISITK